MKHRVEEDGRGETAADRNLSDNRTKAKVPLSRFPIQRFRVILGALQDGETTMGKIAEEIEVSPKTIARDVEFLRDWLLFPIEGDWKGIHLTAPLVGCPLCAIIHPEKRKDDPKDHDKTAKLIGRIFASL